MLIDKQIYIYIYSIRIETLLENLNLNFRVTHYVTIWIKFTK